MEKKPFPPSVSRREFVKKAAYAAPVIVTLTAMPSFARAGSTKQTYQPQPFRVGD